MSEDFDSKADSAGPGSVGDVLARLAAVEDDFERVRDNLADLQRLATLGTLVATVAHEFNNLLTPIISYAQLALSRPGDTELGRKAHTKALEGALRASNLCSSLLGYARDHSEEAESDVIPIVRSVLDCFGQGLANHGIEVRTELTEARVGICPGDLEQVLVNLILNARKAMAGRGGTLTVRSSIERDRLRLEVQDTGRGVPSEIADRLFEPFVTKTLTDEANGTSLNRARTHTTDQGTGLGLSVCRDLVEHVGGEIGFESSPDEGTTFYLLLPLARMARQSA
ncbi:MAG: hypothetical protein Kow00105_14720 [Phycisphaeraceae bacterium]